MSGGSSIRRERPELFDEIDRGIESGEYVNRGKTKRVSPRARDINWKVVRECFVLGKRKQLEDGIWVSEDYTYLELCEKFQLKLNTLKHKAADESWAKLRKAYLCRVNSVNIGQELGLYTKEQYQAEISALNACNKLGIILDRYIENKFSEVLNKVEDTDVAEDYKDEIFHQYNEDKFGNQKPVVELSELKDAVKVAQDIYSLQKKIYDNAPNTEKEIIEEISRRPKFRNAKEREAKIAQLSAKLGKNLASLADLTTIEADSVPVK